MKAQIGDIAAAVFLLAVVMLLVRPGSYAPGFIKGFGDAMTALVKYAVQG